MNIFVVFVSLYFLFEVGSTQTDSETGDGGNPVACDEKNPICQKFRLMNQRFLQNRQPRLTGFENIDQKSVGFESAQRLDNANGNSTEDLQCDEEDPICKKFKALLSYHRSVQLLKKEKGKPAGSGNASPGGNSGEGLCKTPWGQFVCENIQRKVCYTNKNCGELVNESD